MAGRGRRLPVAIRLIMALAALIAVGTAVLSLPGMAVRPLTFMEALFTATSAATVTGLSVLTTSTDFTRLGQFVILLLAQVGGVGLVIAVVLILRLFGRRISLVDRLAMSSSLGLDQPRAIVRIVRSVLLFILVIEGLGALLLYVYWRSAGIVPADEAAFYALFHAVMAFCNAGFDLFAGLPRYPAGIPGDAVTLIILGLLVFVGGLGFPVYMDLLYHSQRRLLLHTRITLTVSLVLVTVGFLLLLVSEISLVLEPGGLSLGEVTVRAWFQSVSARTAGFPGFAGFEDMRQSSRLIIMLLMFIGSAPASMGGGITTGTFAVLGLAVVSFARGFARVRVWRRTISPNSVRRATAILVTSLGAVSISSLLLLLTHDLTLDVAIFEVISAFSTTGLSLGATNELNTFGRWAIILMMFWGRLGAVTVMIALLKRTTPELLVDYPQENVLVG